MRDLLNSCVRCVNIVVTVLGCVVMCVSHNVGILLCADVQADMTKFRLNDSSEFPPISHAAAYRDS
jgi:hypothetical protein